MIDRTNMRWNDLPCTKKIKGWMLLLWLLCPLCVLSAVPGPRYDYAVLERESLGRGLVAVRQSNTQIYLSWRYLETDPVDIAFNVYRARVLGDKIYTPVKKNKELIRDVCWYVDELSSSAISGPYAYYVQPVYQDSIEGSMSNAFVYKGNAYIEIPMQAIPGDNAWTYSPNDASLGDLDGDGEYEIVLKREPDNTQDNSKSGETGVTYLEAYRMDGTMLWRINLGRNIRSGAHYTQFMVYDFDGDGMAEVVCKTADGTIDGTGVRIGTESVYVDSDGYILSGPEYLSIFNGKTGAAMKTIPYNPPRLNNNTTNLNKSLLQSIWGDNYGNRCDRYLAAVAYLDGVHPSIVMCRGYYRGKSNNGRTTLWALDWRNGELTTRWLFDSYNRSDLASYTGQGFHNLRVGDIDGDGKDEIVYGACTIDDNGKPYRTTGYGHGDAMHLSDIDPDMPGLEIWTCHEDKSHGSRLRRAFDDKELIAVPSGDDVGRCMTADIDPDHRGYEVWSSRSGGVLSCKGKVITSSTSGVSMNMACWWDGRLNRNLMDGTKISRWTPTATTTLLSASACASNNSTKSNPCLQGDVVGDWREEAIWRTSDNKNIRIYVSTTQTPYRFHCFMQEPIYRISVATQNVAYNQPTQPGFYFGSDLEKIFVERDIHCYEDSLVLDPVFEHARAWKWSTGDTTKLLVLRPESTGWEKPTYISLEMNYRGYLFRDSLRVTFHSTTALFPVEEAPLMLYPTKAADYICIVLPEGENKLSVYDTKGRLYIQKSGLAGNRDFRMDVSVLKSGFYLLRLEREGFNAVAGFVKK